MHPIYTYIKQTLAPFYSDMESGALAKWILTDVFHLTVVDLYTGKDMKFSADETNRLEVILDRLKSYEPLQYILGTTTFCGLSFEVTPAVLIPRPETAELVGWIVEDCKGKNGLNILDVGTGSGCIPVSLARLMKSGNPQISAWDVSEAALQVARRNACRNQVEVTFVHQDVLSATYPKLNLDILVSNPPYIPFKEKQDMEKNVLDWEPELALFVPDDNPLLFYRRIAEIGLQLLVPSGALYYEINQKYGRETQDMLLQLGYTAVELRKDLSGNDRMIKAIKP